MRHTLLALWVSDICGLILFVSFIQHGGDFDDWQREVTLMIDVYLNSFCNISAADAPDSHHTMFNSRNPDALYP